MIFFLLPFSLFRALYAVIRSSGYFVSYCGVLKSKSIVRPLDSFSRPFSLSRHPFLPHFFPPNFLHHFIFFFRAVSEQFQSYIRLLGRYLVFVMVQVSAQDFYFISVLDSRWFFLTLDCRFFKRTNNLRFLLNIWVFLQVGCAFKMRIQVENSKCNWN